MHNKQFKSAIPGIEEVLCFRALNLSDEKWIQDEFPDYEERAGGEKVDLYMFARILFRVLENKANFAAETVSEMGEDGKTTTREIGGVDKFMNSLVGDESKIKLIESFVAVCAMSRPDAKIEETDEKKDQKKKKKLGLSIIGILFIISLSITTGLILKYAI